MATGLNPQSGQGNQSAAIADVVAASGTAEGEIVDVTAAFDQDILNDNFQELATKQNQILAALRAAGIIKT